MLARINITAKACTGLPFCVAHITTMLQNPGHWQTNLEFYKVTRGWKTYSLQSDSAVLPVFCGKAGRKKETVRLSCTHIPGICTHLESPLDAPLMFALRFPTASEACAISRSPSTADINTETSLIFFLFPQSTERQLRFNIYFFTSGAAD